MKNLKEQPTFKAKLAYIGPLQKSRDPYRILLDLTKLAKFFLESVTQKILTPLILLDSENRYSNQKN